MLELDYERNIFTAEENGITLIVEPDSHATNPRDEEYNNKLLLWGNQDFIGDENSFDSIAEFDTVMTDAVIFRKLPVFLDNDTHNISHIANSNSRHVGYIYMTKETAKQRYITLNSIAEQYCEDYLKGCIKEYNNYINGRIYGYTIKNEDGDILDGGNDYYPQETMLDTIKEMAEYCQDKYLYLFDTLIAEMEKGNTPLKKFTNCDVFAVLGEIVNHNVQHYKSDFGYDRADFQNAAYSPYSAETNFLWLARPNGTEITTEREAYVKDTRGHNTWIFFGEQTNDPIVAYAVDIKGTEGGSVVGDLYELDYNEHYKRVIQNSLPPHKIQLTYRHSNKLIDYEPHWIGRIQNHELLRTVTLPADLREWDEVLNAARNERQNTYYEEWDLDRLKKSFEVGKIEQEMD